MGARTQTPRDVVVAAYEAANRGRYSIANAFIAPEFRRMLVRTDKLAVTTGKILRRALAKLRGRRDEASSRKRRRLLTLMKVNRMTARVRVGSPRALRDMWNAATRARSLARVVAIRQVVRGSRARVYLRLTLRDGTVVKDSEPLVHSRGTWFLG